MTRSLMGVARSLVGVAWAMMDMVRSLTSGIGVMIDEVLSNNGGRTFHSDQFRKRGYCGCGQGGVGSTWNLGLIPRLVLGMLTSAATAYRYGNHHGDEHQDDTPHHHTH